jgi:group I intron endonuclease
MFYIIYKITNLINNRYYIGMHGTQDLNDNYMGSGLAIKNAIKKYGLENFKKEVLSVHETKEQMIFEEKNLLTTEALKDPLCYNIAKGGQGGFVFSGLPNQDKMKKIIGTKVSMAKKGVKFSEKHKSNISKNHADVSGEKNPMYGKNHKNSTLTLIRERAKNRTKKTCSHCGKNVDASNFKRWHGDNCKEYIIARQKLGLQP